MFILVVYDVTSNRRRTQVANELLNFGERVQLSAFECHLDSESFRQMHRRLAALINWRRDRLSYYRICDKDRRQICSDGLGEVTREKAFYMV